MPKLKVADYTGVIIDGAIPRSEAVRCSDILDYAELIIENQSWPEVCYVRNQYLNLKSELTIAWDDDMFEWNELEDKVIDLINFLLPKDVVCVLNDGDVLVWDVRHDD